MLTAMGLDPASDMHRTFAGVDHCGLIAPERGLSNLSMTAALYPPHASVGVPKAGIGSNRDHGRPEARDMKRMSLIIALGLVLAGTACHDLKRSREVDNPSVSGKTIAQQV